MFYAENLGNCLTSHSATFGEKKNQIHHVVFKMAAVLGNFWDFRKNCFAPKIPLEYFFFKFYFRNVIVLMFFYYEPNFIEKFLRESVFSFFPPEFLPRNENRNFGRHFETAKAIFIFFSVLWLSWSTLSVTRVLLKNLSRKVVFRGWVHLDPPPLMH